MIHYLTKYHNPTYVHVQLKITFTEDNRLRPKNVQTKKYREHSSSEGEDIIESNVKKKKKKKKAGKAKIFIPNTLKIQGVLISF